MIRFAHASAATGANGFVLAPTKFRGQWHWVHAMVPRNSTDENLKIEEEANQRRMEIVPRDRDRAYCRVTGYAEVSGVPTTTSGSNRRLGCSAEPCMPVVASEMLVPFKRVEDDWTERRPPSKRRRATA